MAKDIKSYERWANGIADYEAEGVEDSYAFGRAIDHRSDPTSFKLLPKTIKESGNAVIDLIKWCETVSGTSYMIGDAGNFYKRTSAGSYSLLRSIADNSGNGLSYFAEDDYVYYPSDKVIGRYGPVGGTASFTDDFLGAQGGVPTNTASIDFESGSSQYASRADTASLSITGDISLETWVNPESLPTSGNSMTLISKWDESGTLRSYKFDIAAVSGYFGDGSDGALNISTNTTEAPIDASCSGTISTATLSATNASFAADQIVLIHQSRGTGAGTWERKKILSYTAGTITLTENLAATYTDSGASQAQVRVLKQYTDVTVDSGITYAPKDWDGNVGGILAFLANGTVTVTGTIKSGYDGSNPSSGTGYQRGTVAGGQGEGTAGDRNSVNGAANGNGGGGASGGTDEHRSGGGGGGHWAAGGTGTGSGGRGGTGGTSAGTADLTTLVFGGGGGASNGNVTVSGGEGGTGAGIVFIIGTTVTVVGAITSNGSNGQVGGSFVGPGGGGSGGSILIKAQTATLGSALITATGGLGATGGGGNGGAGSVGRIHLDYYTSYTGTTSPTLNATQDNSLVTNTTYQMRFAVSSTGSNSETLTKEFTPQTASWQHLATTWDASEKLATFYLNGSSLGTRTGTLTAIHDNTGEFFVAANKNSGGSAANFYDGLMDDARVWGDIRTAAEIVGNMSDHVLATADNLKAYYKFENGVTDSQTSGNNNLTASGSPTYSTSVPFSGATTRLDIDQSATTSGQTYTNTTSISEAAANRKEFTPAKDPQKSIAILVATVGSGNWTITVHDSLNAQVAAATVVNGSIATGYQEFVFSTPWRPIINNTYHFHVTSTVADGTTTCTTLNDLSTVSFRTYYQFLMTDTEWHPAIQFLNYMVIGNERYLAKYEATLYTPHILTFPAGWRVRALGLWREYLAIGVQKGSGIDDNDQGRVYFWDGTASTFNFFIDVPEGGINALLGSKGKLYVWAGYQGDVLLYQGGDSAEKIKRIPKITDSTTVEIYPGAMTMYKSLLRFGVAGGGDSTAIEKGVYTHGSLNTRYAESLSYDYPISTGTLTGTTLKVGMVTVVNKKLLIGWQSNISYGVDYIDASNNPYATGTLELLVADEGAYWKDKAADSAIVHFDELNSGETVKIKSSKV